MKWRRRSSTPQHAASGDKRLRILLILVLVLMLLKILCSLSALSRNSINDELKIFNADVAAKEKQPESSENKDLKSSESDNASAHTQSHLNNQWSIELAEALKQRERELNQKQEILRREEERLNELKREVQERIQTLSELEKKISELISTKKTIEEEKLLKLAKVFEETPPEQAGPLLSRLDVDIAAELLLKMTGRKAGKIWGYVDPARAVEISKALARINPNINLDGLSDNKSAER